MFAAFRCFLMSNLEQQRNVCDSFSNVCCRPYAELQFRLMIAQKGLSPPHSPTKQRGLRGGARGAPGVPPHKLAAATAAAVPAAAASAGPGVATTAAAAQSQGEQGHTVNGIQSLSLCVEQWSIFIWSHFCVGTIV